MHVYSNGTEWMIGESESEAIYAYRQEPGCYAYRSKRSFVRLRDDIPVIVDFDHDDVLGVQPPTKTAAEWVQVCIDQGLKTRLLCSRRG